MGKTSLQSVSPKLSDDAATVRRTTLEGAAKKAGIPHVSSHTFRHTYRTWLDLVGTPVGVQQKLMRHSHIRTTMNIYGDVVSEDVRRASEKVARMAVRVV